MTTLYEKVVASRSTLAEVPGAREVIQNFREALREHIGWPADFFSIFSEKLTPMGVKGSLYLSQGSEFRGVMCAYDLNRVEDTWELSFRAIVPPGTARVHGVIQAEEVPKDCLDACEMVLEEAFEGGRSA